MHMVGGLPRHYVPIHQQSQTTNYRRSTKSILREGKWFVGVLNEWSREGQ